MKTILVVDDEKGIRLALDRQLKRAGYNVYVADGGQQALEVLQKKKIDLVLLDHKMPDMDGLETFKAMQEQGLINGIPVGMMTAYGSIPLVTEFMKEGGAFFVEKPFYAGILEAIISKEINIAETTRRQVEARTAELNRLKEQAESASKLKSQILENLEHQTRTPLAVAMGYAELLKDSEMPEDMRRQLAIPLYDSLQSLHKLLEDIWYASRLQSWLQLNIEDVLLAECINAVPYREITQAKGLALEIDVSDIKVRADRKALAKVFDCLLDNAVKFTLQGNILVRAQESEEGVVILVQDTGIGIAKEKFEVIFDIFFKVDESGFQTGTGVGLSVAKTLVEAMDGRIWVESEMGQGSTFYFTLPKGHVSEIP